MPDCLDKLRKAFKGIDRRLSNGDGEDSDMKFIEGAFAELERLPIGGYDKAQMIEKFGRDLDRASATMKRTSALNALARQVILSETKEIMSREGLSASKAIRALLVGSEHQASNSVAANQMGEIVSVANKMEHEIRGLGEAAWKKWQNGTVDKDIMKSVIAHQDGISLSGVEMDADAQAMGKIISDSLEYQRVSFNQYGADIGKKQNRGIRNSYNPRKMRERGEDAFVEAAIKNLDYEDLLGIPKETVELSDELMQSVEDMFRYEYQQLASGHHLVSRTPGEDSQRSFRASGFGMGNITKTLSQSRVFNWKDSDAHWEMHYLFGFETMAEAVAAEMKSNATRLPIAKRLGPNYDNNVRWLFDELARESPDVKNLKEMADTRASIEKDLDFIDGSTRIPGDHIASGISQAVLQVNVMAKMGSVAPAMIPDVQNIASELKIHGGGMLDVYSRYASNVANFKFDKELSISLSEMGVPVDVARAYAFSDVHANDAPLGFFSNNTLARKIGWGIDKFSKLTGMAHLNNAATITAGVELSLTAARKAGTAFDELDKGYRMLLAEADVTPELWEMSKYMLQEVDTPSGKVTVLNPSSIDKAPRELMEKYAKSIYGTDEVTDIQIPYARDRGRTAFISFLADSFYSSVLSAKPRTKRLLGAGTGGKTEIGLKHITQFKSFPVSFMMQRMMRRFRHEVKLADGSVTAAVPGLLGHVAQSMVMLTGLGYVSLAITDFLKGKEIPDPSGDHAASVWAESMLRGGGAGFFGDALLGEMEPMFGSGVADYFLGVPATNATDIYKVLRGGVVAPAEYLWGETRKGNKEVGKILKVIHDNTPGQNLIWTRIATQTLFNKYIMDFMDPGRWERMNKNMQEKTGQTYYSDNLF